MSAVRHMVLRVETMLFRRHFVVVTIAVGVLKTPEKSSKFPPTVILVRCVLNLYGLMSHTFFPYVTFFLSMELHDLV